MTTSSQPSTSPHSKPCTICTTPRDVLVRCQTDSTGRWHFVCPGTCWRDVSGGRVDGDGEHPDYRYGGMWKNKHEGVSAKRKKKGGKTKSGKEDEVKAWVPCNDGNGEEEEDEEHGDVKRYTKNDRVRWDGRVWVCRKSHWGGDAKGTPEEDIGLWKEDDAVVDVNE